MFSWPLVPIGDCLDQLLNPVWFFFPLRVGCGFGFAGVLCKLQHELAVRSSSEWMPLPTCFINSFIVRAVKLYCWGSLSLPPSSPALQSLCKHQAPTTESFHNESSCLLFLPVAPALLASVHWHWAKLKATLLWECLILNFLKQAVIP